ncbi:ABC transporter substrate-binding protein [Lapillicoccus jejuensis]|uniref:Amino acid ABC transporter substrate-binding protein (PAAT family) n=1 Tax=Lapillicoccus jejuensis TaxID=402171 RepID=A0A542E2D6_9MICO|nr:ABC transporter substrate-binding protein [Lapillicoccus jejuensis]TQJ09500.1 amino acid ABC transporter substrate-binding protein (PAAT family) [Lapillicoccus jejuensis]
MAAAPPPPSSPGRGPTARRAVAPVAALAAVAGIALAGLLGLGTTPPATASGSGSPAPVATASSTVDPALRARLPEQIRAAGVVRVATDVPYPPFEMFTSPGSTRMTGLDYDLGQAIGGVLGVRFVFGEQKFDGIVPAIQAGKYDVVMSAMTDTRQRQKVLDFVDYSASGSGILVAAGNPAGIRTLLDLCGRKVAVQSGSKQAAMLAGAQDPCTAAGRPKPVLAQYPKDTDAQLAIVSGAADADFMDKPAAGYVARTAGGGTRFEVVDDPAAPTGTDATPNGIGVSKALPGLAPLVRQALQRLIDDGTYGRILDAYGEKGIGIRTATINGGTS